MGAADFLRRPEGWPPRRRRERIEWIPPAAPPPRVTPSDPSSLAGDVRHREPRHAYVQTPEQIERRERRESRERLCEACEHYTPATALGVVAACGLIPKDDGKAPCRREFQRIRLQGQPHPHPDCPWNADAKTADPV